MYLTERRHFSYLKGRHPEDISKSCKNFGVIKKFCKTVFLYFVNKMNQTSYPNFFMCETYLSLEKSPQHIQAGDMDRVIQEKYEKKMLYDCR